MFTIIRKPNKISEGENPRCVALIVAAGNAKRFGNAEKGKMLVKVKGKTMLEHCLEIFEKSKYIDEINIVAKDILSAYQYVDKYKKNINVVVGGKTRQISVMNGLASIRNADYVVIHDVARPCVKLELIEECIEKAIETGHGATLAVPVTDTIKKVENGTIVSNIARDNLWQMQTPQVFPCEKLLEAHRLAKSQGIKVTDDTAVYMILDEKVEVVESANDNIKITYPQDIIVAERIIENHEDFDYSTSI